ncbi:MAG TPA: hypothetical protein VM938_12740 [Acidimicrobiales bacterium]|nr:hypothetical protein [Acidimicrobiales bacterium]
MFRRILRRKALFAFVGAFLMLAQAADAGHAMNYNVTQDTYVKSQYPDVSGYTYYGSATPLTSTTDIPSGYDVAQSTGTSPFADNPSDEEVVGSGTATARWVPFCASSNLGLTAKWETTMPATKPANTVGMVTIEAAGGLFTTEAFIVREGASNYKIEVPQMPNSSVCNSTTTGAMTLNLLGETADGSDVVRNPATAGTYTWSSTYTDDATPAGTHSDTTDVVITN